MSPERRVSSKPSRSAMSSPFYPRNPPLLNTPPSASSAYVHLARQHALEHTLSQIHHAKLSAQSRHPKFQQLQAIYEEYVRQCELRRQQEPHRQHPRPHQCQQQHHRPSQSQPSFHNSDTPDEPPSPTRLLIPSSPAATRSARSADSGTDSAACTPSLNFANLRRHSYRAQTQGQDQSPVNHRHISAGSLEPTSKEMSIRDNDIVRRLLSSVTSFQKSLPAAAGSTVVRENIEQLSHRLHSHQRIRSRETSPYSLHHWARSSEPQTSLSSHPSMLSPIPDLVHSSPSIHSQAEDGCYDIVKQEDTDDSRPIGAIKREPGAVATPLPSPGKKAGRSSSPRDHMYSPVSRSSSRSSDSIHGPKMKTTTATLPSRECSCQTCNPCCTKDAPAPAPPHHDIAKQEVICPWGMPGLPPPIPHRRRPQHQSDEPSFKPDPSRVTLNYKAWTLDEKRALYLAATQSRLPHQWSKIRGMTNLHRTDQEIETEYQKLFGHRTNGSADEDEDEDKHRERNCTARQYYRGGYRSEGLDKDTDGDADDETERARFMGYYGGEPRLLSMDARARQWSRKGFAHHRSHYRSVVSSRHGPPEPIRVQHFQLEKIPLRI